MKMLCAADLLPKSDSVIDRAGMLPDHLGADLSLLHGYLRRSRIRRWRRICSARVGS